MKPLLKLIAVTALLTGAVVPIATCIGRSDLPPDLRSVTARPVAGMVRAISSAYLPHQIVVLDEVFVLVEPGAPSAVGALGPGAVEVPPFQVCTQWRPVTLETADHGTRSVHARICDVVDQPSAPTDTLPLGIRAPRSRVEFESSAVTPMQL